MQSAKSRDPSREFQLENSRDLAEISMIDNSRNSSFRFEAPPSRTPPLDTANQRYQNLQRMLNKAKTNSLDNFYRNLDQQHVYKVQDKFKSKEEFKQYRNDLKAYKKSLEEDFQTRNGNYRFQNNNYRPPNADSANFAPNPPVKQEEDFFNAYNFKKKATARPDPNNFFANK